MSVPVAVCVPGVALTTPRISVTEPVVVPEMMAASLLPLMVIVTTWGVPSTVVTVKVSVSVPPTLSACTTLLALLSV